MRESERNSLYLYLMNNLTRLEGDLIDCQNHMRFRRIDDVDCLEYIIALNRLRAFQEFAADVSAILRLYDVNKKSEM